MRATLQTLFQWNWIKLWNIFNGTLKNLVTTLWIMEIRETIIVLMKNGGKSLEYSNCELKKVVEYELTCKVEKILQVSSSKKTFRESLMRKKIMKQYQYIAQQLSKKDELHLSKLMSFFFLLLDDENIRRAENCSPKDKGFHYWKAEENSTKNFTASKILWDYCTLHYICTVVFISYNLFAVFGWI